MKDFRIVSICELPERRAYAAKWFHQKWSVPEEEYLKSIDECLIGKKAIPQWYLALADDKIIGGLGVIENDFHRRKDLAPNVCALFVEEKYRSRGIAGRLLEHVCSDMYEKGIGRLYLVTDHTSFYERYGWKFVCMADADDSQAPVRVYEHIQQKADGT